jgi:outer membrane lipase/esterase
VLDAYDNVKSNALTRADALLLMKAQGTKLGQLVNQIANAGDGGRVLFALTPDISYSPYATAEETLVAGRKQLLRDLVNELNSAARLAVIDNGRWAALMTANETVSSMYRFPASYSLGNVTVAGCSVALPNCDTTTLVDTSVNYLWADDRHMGPSAHGQIGSAALNRARNNPF